MNWWTVVGTLATGFVTWLTWHIQRTNRRERLRSLAEKKEIEDGLAQSLLAEDLVTHAYWRRRMQLFAEKAGHPL